MTEMIIDRNGTSGTVKLSGDLTIEMSGEVKARLLEALDGAELVEVDLKGVSGIDLTVMQVLCGAHRASVKSDRRFVVVGASPVLRQYARASGFARRAGCSFDKRGDCIWTGI